MSQSDTSQQPTLRILDLTFDTGARQLATTEAILLAVGQGLAPPTLRLYSWSEPVVILGVGQPYSDLNLPTCQERGYRILRRIGGGTAVYHDAEEVSVDFIVETGTSLGPTDVHAGYKQFATFLNDALNLLNIHPEVVTIEQARSATQDERLKPICFASLSPFEFMHDNRKLDGICQIRRRDAIAYQAAIYNRFPVEPLIASLNHENEELRNARSEWLSNFATDMATIRGQDVEYGALQHAIVQSAAEMFGLAVERSDLTEYERGETQRLIDEKYGNDEWTFRR
jgi:lipoyl(octanoyl) transferase